ncbi:Acetyl-CoA biotin carboxyl carrier [Caulifigura coniformis]|uniref:Biotin carboxyl carrier protein of acetyl-CoA carboxylase n=1 Tax=Caulifigura coniformis TaxID=2527983 RepID=A0A517SE93_9PLAN|nr:acetyl-CoA carboxylase biotin carboxyl carrier protein [Caulifigura coniformis]QDT54442.1 Acetyl-CoA biotin carboxyl carrier [Caulifigura coniformis]
MPREAASGGPFDLDNLQKLVELMDKFDLNEVKLQKGSDRVILRRGLGGEMIPVQMAAPAVHAAPAPAAASAPAAPAAAAPASEENLPAIKSPTVGTFYSAAQPGEPPFVKAGDRVKSESVVCIIEAMKVFNQIPAKMSGTIVKCLVKDGDPVDFGQPLFLIKE